MRRASAGPGLGQAWDLGPALETPAQGVRGPGSADTNCTEHDSPVIALEKAWLSIAISLENDFLVL